MKALFLGLVLCLAAQSAGAVNPDEMLDDPALEARAREISKGLRCLVCQNQSIDDSDADLARDLRVLVRKRLVAGDSDGQVIDYVVSRYGDFVLIDRCCSRPLARVPTSARCRCCAEVSPTRQLPPSA